MAYQSCRINGKSRMDVETFFGEIRGNVASLITKELQDLDLVKVQTIAWIRFKVEVDGQDGSVMRVNIVDKAFISQMVEVFKGNDLGEIFEEMFPHMRMQVENLALANSEVVFDQVLFLDVNFHQLNLTSPLPNWISSKKVVINKNKKDKECFK